MYHLWDNESKQLIGTYEETEYAVMIVGALMNRYGVEAAQKKYVLTKPPLKSGKAKIVYHPQDLWTRALVYLDRKSLDKFTPSKFGHLLQ